MSTDITGTPQSTHAAGGRFAPLARWRVNPERMAWMILLISFALFVILLIAVPLTVNYAVNHFTVAETAQLESTQGTLLLYPSVNAEPIAVTTQQTDAGEGSRILAADDSTQGTVGLMQDEDSGELLGSVQLYPGTDLVLTRLRRPFFDRSKQPYQVQIRLDKGQARIFTNSSDRRPLSVELITPQGVMELTSGSYNIAVDEEGADMTVRSGEAVFTDLTGARQIAVAGDGLWSTGDTSVVKVAITERNLIRNGDFTQSMADSWRQYNIAPNVENGTVSIIERDGRRVAHFNRQGEEGVHTEVGIFQELNEDVNVFDELVIQLDVRLMYQSLAGAGYLNSEFPLRIEIEYVDIYGKELRWGHGFYYRDPDDVTRSVPDSSKIPAYNWYTYQSPNLMDVLAETRPARINSLRIYASGHNYQSMVSEIYLLAQ
ncbi:MAG: hypothetical protein H6642_18740 [Caldilineaceae bacterium]|nr:hypothetical protein [Caldilineaceae bacterium]